MTTFPLVSFFVFYIMVGIAFMVLFTQDEQRILDLFSNDKQLKNISPAEWKILFVVIRIFIVFGWPFLSIY